MKSADIIATLGRLGPELRPYGISGLYLFGSYARENAGERSDIDIFVDPDPARKFGFDEFMGAYEVLKRALPDADVQYGTRDGLSRYVRDEVESEAIRVF
jgi:predicted nucleotidyltransferase